MPSPRKSKPTPPPSPPAPAPAGDDDEPIDLSAPPGSQADDASEGALRRSFRVRRDVRKRLDRYLQMRLKGVSRNQVQKLIDAGGVSVNDRPVKASTIIHDGDVIDVILPPPPVRYLQPEPIPLSIVYEDDDLIVINKQAGLIVHPARSHLSGTLLNGLAHHFQQQLAEATDGGGATAGAAASPVPPSSSPSKKRRKRGTGAWGLSSVGADDCRPGVVHRLDKNTTGVMVVAKRDQTHWKLARQFEDRQTLKAYLAVVHGEIDPPGDVIDQPIGKHPTIREAYAVRHDSAARPSVTIYRARQRYRGYTLVELELRTGRTHQIRVHLQYIGHPIVGDVMYGGEPVGWPELDQPPLAAGARKYLTFARDKEEGERVERTAAERDDLIMATPALHAALLGFTHPATGAWLTFTAPLHEPMATLVRELRQRPAEGPVVSEGVWVDLQKALPR